MTSICRIDSIPDLITLAFTYTSLTDMRNVMRVKRSWYRIASQDSIWFTFIQQLILQRPFHCTLSKGYLSLLQIDYLQDSPLISAKHVFMDMYKPEDAVFCKGICINPSKVAVHLPNIYILDAAINVILQVNIRTENQKQIVAANKPIHSFKINFPYLLTSTSEEIEIYDLQENCLLNRLPIPAHWAGINHNKQLLILDATRTSIYLSDVAKQRTPTIITHKTATFSSVRCAGNYMIATTDSSTMFDLFIWNINQLKSTNIGTETALHKLNFNGSKNWTVLHGSRILLGYTTYNDQDQPEYVTAIIHLSKDLSITHTRSPLRFNSKIYLSNGIAYYLQGEDLCRWDLNHGIPLSSIKLGIEPEDFQVQGRTAFFKFARYVYVLDLTNKTLVTLHPPCTGSFVVQGKHLLIWDKTLDIYTLNAIPPKNSSAASSNSTSTHPLKKRRNTSLDTKKLKPHSQKAIFCFP